MILNKINEEIPQHLIDDCEKLSENNKKTYFIFDNYSKNYIEASRHPEKDEKREYILEKLFDNKQEQDLPFSIGDLSDLKDMPSRYIYYDTETKQTDKYKRYDFVLSFIKKLGFTPSEHNLGIEYEQVFNMSEEIGGEKIELTIRLNQNLITKISYSKSQYNSNLGGYSGQAGEVYNDFFVASNFLNSLKLIPFTNPNFIKSKIRELKIDNILTY
jgi:hypothetical protein